MICCADALTYHWRLGTADLFASTRDYNTGKYHHDGLAATFRQRLRARRWNWRTANLLSGCRPITGRAGGELDRYVNSSRQNRDDVLQVWQKLEPYRVALPVNVDVVAAQLFVSNIKLAFGNLAAASRAGANGASVHS